MSFKKNFIRFISNRKQNGKSTLQNRAPQLEALEDRHLLDAIGFTSVEQTTFQATFSDQESNESRYLIMEVLAADDVRLSKDFSVSIRDTSAAEGEGNVEFISSKIQKNTASFLANYIISNDKTYVFEVGPELEGQTYEVRFVLAGDMNGDNVVSESEYYQLKGQAFVGQGTNAAFIERFNIIYGVEIPQAVNSLYDLDGNGKLEMETFRKVIEPNFSDTIVLNQEITTVPTINSLKVGGETPVQYEGEDNTFVSNKASSISGKTQAKTCDFTYTTDDGTFSASDFDLTQSSATITLENKDGTGEETIELNYKLQDGTFTITPTSGNLPEGTLKMELDNNFETNLYTIIIDQTAPQIQASKAYIGDTPNENDKYSTKQSDFDLKVNYTLETEDPDDTLEDVLEAEPCGIYLHVSEGNDEIAVKQLTQASDAFVSLTGVKEGTHTYSVKITDLVGNTYGTGTVSVVVNADFTAPTLTVEGYEVPSGKDHMTVMSPSVTLTPKTESDSTVTYDGSLEYTESQGAYTFTLAEGLNSISFTAVDPAGNSTTETCKVYYEAQLELTQGSNVTEYVTTQSGSLNLYDYFNYQSGLDFTVTCNLQNLESFTEDSQNPGTYNYKFKQSALKTTATESIVVIAKTASGEQSATLHINLCYSTAPWTDVTVQNELANLNYHIVKTDGITLRGKLVNPTVPGTLNVFVADEETPVIANVDLAELYAEPDHTKIYDDLRLTFIQQTSDGNTSFVLTLNEVNSSGQTISLEDNKYTLRASQENGDNAQDFVVYRCEEPAPTCVDVWLNDENNPTPNFEVLQRQTPSPVDLLEGVTINVYSDANTLFATTTVTFDENGNINEGYQWTYTPQSLADGIYEFTYEFTNASHETRTDEEYWPYVVDTTAPVLTVKRNGTTLNSGGSAEVSTDMFSLEVIASDTTETTMVCMMYNNQDETDDGYEFDPEDFVLEYVDTRIEVTVTDEMEHSSTWTYNFKCKPVLSDLVQNGKYNLVQTLGAEERVLNLYDLFIFESDSKYLYFDAKGPEEGWELYSNDTIGIDWENLRGSMTLTVTATIEEEQSTEVTVTVVASKAQDKDYPRWINLATDGATIDGKFLMNLSTVSTISGNLYDSSGVDTASLAIYQVNGTQKTLISIVEDLQYMTEDDNLYTLDLTNLQDLEGYSLELEDGEYEIHFYGIDANENPKESTEENGKYQTIQFVVKQAPSAVWSLNIASTNGQDSDYVNALNLSLSSEGQISDWDKQYGLTVTVTGTDGDKTVDLWNGIYKNGAWVSGSGLRTDTTFSVDPKTAGMEDGDWTFTVKTTNNALAEEITEVNTVLDTVPPVITSSLYELDFNSSTKQEASGPSADSMSWAAPDWEMDPVVNLELNNPDFDVTRTYSKELTDYDEFPLEYGTNTLVVQDEDWAGNKTTATYKVVYNSKPELSSDGETAKNAGIYTSYSDSGTEVDLTSYFSDKEEAESALVYSARVLASTPFSVRSCTNGIVTLDAKETPSKTTPILSGSLIAAVKDEFGAELTQNFTVNLVSQYAGNSLENLEFDGSYPITTESDGTLTGDLIIPGQSSKLLMITDQDGSSAELDISKESGTFYFNAEKCSYSCTPVTDIHYALSIEFAEDSLSYGVFSLILDNKTIGELVRRQAGEQPGVPVVSQDSIELPLGENHFEIERLDSTTWSLVFDDGQTIQVTGENVYADSELRVIDLLPDSEGRYTLAPLTNVVEIVFINSDGKASSTWTTINLVYSETVIDESLNVSGDDAIVKAKILGTCYDEDTLLTYEFTNLELESLEGFTIPPNHAISQISLNSSKHLVVTYHPYNVEQVRTPIGLTAQMSNGQTIQFNLHMQYEKPFTLVASVTKPYEATTTSTTAPKSLVSVDSPVDYSQREYDVNDPDDAYQLDFQNFNMQIWLKVDLPIVSKELYDKYDIPYSNNVIGFNSTIKVTGGEVKTVSSRSLFDKTVTTSGGVTSVLAKVAAVELSGLSELCACGTDGNYSCILELVVQPDVLRTSPVFTVSFDKSESTMELFQYKTSAESSDYSTVNPTQINDGLTGQTIQLKYKEAEALPAPQAESQAAPIAASALQVETAFAMPQSAVAEIALLEDVNSLNPAVQSSAPVTAPAENASTSLAVESWIQNGNESLGCTTILSSGIVDKDALIDSLASSPAIQQTANAVVDSIFEEEDA